MKRLIALALAGWFDTVGSAASAVGNYCLASADCISEAIEQRDKEERKKARIKSQLDRARREIDALPVAER